MTTYVHTCNLIQPLSPGSDKVDLCIGAYKIPDRFYIVDKKRMILYFWSCALSIDKRNLTKKTNWWPAINPCYTLQQSLDPEGIINGVDSNIDPCKSSVIRQLLNQRKHKIPLSKTSRDRLTTFFKRRIWCYIKYSRTSLTRLSRDHLTQSS